MSSPDALSLWDNWLRPFSPGQETDDDPAYDDSFQLMREEINKLSGADPALLFEVKARRLKLVRMKVVRSESDKARLMPEMETLLSGLIASILPEPWCSAANFCLTRYT